MIELQEVPTEHHKLYQDYLAKVKSNKLPRMMFVVLDYGHQIMQFEKETHIKWTISLLSSGIENNVQQAVEAMSRTLGEWRNR
ncbi:MAG: hypothetical protein AUF65_02365 [Chloroflexi bacterium 13_1_20CM_50_12]|nr:MAG: hypothetical protein AUF65_02365 [Chloroflexi bacterium 13_1_20CM_50_12]